MKEELSRFILANKLSPFEATTITRSTSDSIFKTRDAKAVHTRVLNQVSNHFVFTPTNSLWQAFDFTNNYAEITKRQTFHKTLTKTNNDFLKELEHPRKKWKPKYDIIVVTEDENTYMKLKDLGCATQLLVSENDVLELERYDIVQVVDVDDFQLVLERLPQSVFLNNVEDVYLERYLEELSGWKHNYLTLKKHSQHLSEDIQNLLLQLEDLFPLLENPASNILTEEEVERVVEGINEKIATQIQHLTITGSSLMEMLSQGKMPAPILDIVRNTIEATGISEHIFNMHIPITIDHKELEEQIRRQSATEYTNLAEQVKRHANKLKNVPQILTYLSTYILIEDFCIGIAQWKNNKNNYPTESTELHMINSKNTFLNNAQPISFTLNHEYRCSILTGANSGGKTTLLEHVLQTISLYQLGLPISGTIKLPTFTDIYYFAKTKGSASKGAFETLLSQMSKIKPGTTTLILADEIEAVTEPGIAGKIIAATADYFLNKGSYIILATHLGHEIQKNLPPGARIDGIEAKGLDEQFNLIVDHNPVLGRLAHSTPELIVQRMAKAHNDPYFNYLYQSIQEN